jgi:effector-binding domain-containing protein
MKVLKTIGVLLLSLFAIAMILMLVVPAKQHIERTIIINAPVSVVYKHLSNPATFYNWMVWCRKDTSIRTAVSDEASDVPGATTFWIGNPETSGKGMIEFISMKVNREIEHKVTFLEPRKEKAKSEFKLLDANGQTKLTWEFDLATPRPRNILNLFTSLDKKLGDEFEEGLINLKAIIEKTGVASAALNARSYAVQPMNFPATSFAVYQQEKVNRSDIPSFYATHLPRIYEEVMTVKATPGSPSGLFYVWDEANQQSDMAAAIAVPAGTQIDNNDIQIVDIPASKAVYIDYYGDHSQTAQAYKSIDKYLLANSLKQKAPVIEQYITDPAIEKDTAKWLTKIIFLVE